MARLLYVDVPILVNGSISGYIRTPNMPIPRQI